MPGPVSTSGRKGVRAVSLDAMGTLVALEPPAPRLRAELRLRTGVDVDVETAEEAFAVEIGFYVEHHLEGRDRPSLERLRDRCAAVLADALALGAGKRPAVRASMLAALSFRAQPDAVPALRAVRERGTRLVVASNWDCSLGRALAEAGLAPLVDAVVASAEVGAAKPDPAVLEVALDAVGVDAADAVHVGDSLAQDVAGARAAGIRAVLVDRDGEPETPSAVEGVPVIRTLGELPSLLSQDS